MTRVFPYGISDADVRLLINDAQKVVRRVAQLRDGMWSPETGRWIESFTGQMDQAWRRLMMVVDSGQGEYFTTEVRAIISIVVPLGDAPTELASSVNAIRALNNVLAEDFHNIITPLIDDKRLRPEVYDQLREILPRLAPEFDE